MKLKRFIKFKQTGISLIEVIVSTTIFVVILLSMTGIFKMVIDAQRQAIASQNVEESLRYFFEVISKEIRMSVRTDGACNIPAGSIYATGANGLGDVLYLKNYRNQCIKYSLVNNNGVNRFQIENSTLGKSDYLSPRKINISALRFVVHELPNEQAYVTINLTAHYVGGEKARSEMTVQTSISSRYYRPN